MNTYKKELIFAAIAAVFLGSLTMMNILGISRFVDLSFSFFGLQVPMVIPIGILPYPITFLCTDVISELYGKSRANWLVFCGLMANVWILFALWLAGSLPPTPVLDITTGLPAFNHPDFAFYQIRFYALGGIIASMMAYVCAQFLDVHLYHWIGNLTQGKHLWLRNNGSTLISQALDTLIVLSISKWLVNGFPVGEGHTVTAMFTLVMNAYCFKMIAALIDTIPLYIIVRTMKRHFAAPNPSPLKPMDMHA